MACSDRKKCSFSNCQFGGELSDEISRAEVKTFLPKESVPNLMVSWDMHGEAKFHHRCWSILTNSSKRNEAGIKLSSVELKMIKEASKTAEFHDSSERVGREASRIAKMLRGASHAIAFTGAGISTAAGIGDFRGKSGKWTTRDGKKDHGTKFKAKKRVVNYPELRPTYTHEAICKLVEMGILKHLISQNCDGLHRLSGIPRQKMSELHGNSFEAKCEICDAHYEFPFVVRTLVLKKGSPNYKRCPTCRLCHRTKKKCEREECTGFLRNTIVNFGDNLVGDVLRTATEHAKKADMVFALGSSLRVMPACNLVEMGKEPIRLVICVRQPTPFDSICKEGPGSRIFGDCDKLMREVMRHLLGEEELQEWEDGQEDRLQCYAQMRTELPYSSD